MKVEAMGSLNHCSPQLHILTSSLLQLATRIKEKYLLCMDMKDCVTFYPEPPVVTQRQIDSQPINRLTWSLNRALSVFASGG